MAVAFLTRAGLPKLYAALDIMLNTTIKFSLDLSETRIRVEEESKESYGYFHRTNQS
ncbi:hypothetical protein PEC730217_22660 [Pectobacterium carotovorum subsp. carotovorum]|nr:hypothetical protein PEC730217_22660 [Pectobacterium carotovorum subsp. carotovorum]